MIGSWSNCPSCIRSGATGSKLGPGLKLTAVNSSPFQEVRLDAVPIGGMKWKNAICRAMTADGMARALDVTLAAESQTAVKEFVSGTVLKHYEIIRKLGQGGMGAVYLGRDIRLGRLVAIKLLQDHAGLSAQRFLSEARATALCRHENIVVIYDVDEVDGCPYMVLEYIQGRTLREAMAEETHENAAMAVAVVLPVARALACAHEMGIVHRDLKPENILLADNGQVKVVDFGIAKQLHVDIAPNDNPIAASLHEWAQTQEGVLVGTLPYMSPEQWLGDDIDARTDIWAVGVILFELLFGAHPLEPLTTAKLAHVADLETPMPSARERRPDLSALADVVDRCLKKSKIDRFASGGELAEALARQVGKTEINADENPFAGLAAFQESDATRFFGRDNDIAAVLGRLRNQQIILVAGPSGAGKSSFIRAGVVPALKRAGRDTETLVLRPGRRPILALADILAFFTDTTADTTTDSNPEAIAEVLVAQPGYLGARLRSRCRRRGADHRILLFVDQLEEIYTLNIDADERAAFWACLEGVADDASSPLRIIMAMRGDFLDWLSEDRRIAGEIMRGLYLLPKFSRESLREALVKPVAAAGYHYSDDSLVDEMLDVLDGTRSPLPLLQFTATKLWEARDPDKRELSRQAYRALGGVAGALSTHADAVLSGMRLSDQKLARAIFLRLVTPERTRAIIQMEELAALAEDEKVVQRLLQHLVEARLLSIDGKTVELTHESLIERWAKLRLWLDESEQDAQFLAELRSAAAQWEKKGEANGFLWRDQAAENAASWYAKRGDSELGKREQRYIEAVIRLLSQSRRRQRRLAALLIAALCLVVFVISVLLVQSNREAAQARNATRMAVAREQQADPTTVVALLREIEPSTLPRGWGALAISAIGEGVTEVVLPHESNVLTAAFSPDGTRIVTATEDKIGRIFRLYSDRAQSAKLENLDSHFDQPILLVGHEKGLTRAQWNSEGTRVVTGAKDKTVRIWDATGKGLIHTLRGHDDTVWGVAFSPDDKFVASTSQDTTIRIWNADGSGDARVFRGHEGTVWMAAYSSDGKRIVTSSNDKTVRIWNTDGTGEPVVLKGHEGPVISVAFRPDGQQVVSGSNDKTVRIWNADGSGEPRVLRGHATSIYGVGWSPDGQRISSASTDGTIRIWNADGSGEAEILKGHSGSVNAVLFSPDNQRLVSASEDKTARVWSAAVNSRRLTFQGHEEVVNDVAIDPQGQHIASISEDKTIRIWNADGSGQPTILRGHEQGVRAVVYSPDGKRLASSSDDKTARIWNADGTGEPIVFAGHQHAVLGLDWSPDGQRLVTACADKMVRIWNADGTGPALVTLAHETPVGSVAWSPDGRRLVSGAEDGTVRIWNANGEGAPVVLEGHDQGVYGLAWSPNGKQIITSSWDATLRLWNTDGTRQSIVLRGHEGPALVRGNKSVSPDGQRVVSASNDGTIRIWSMDGIGDPVVLRISTRPVNSAVFSSDGKRIVMGADDKTVRVWADLEPVKDPTDQRLWSATAYCIPLDVRRQLLGFSDDQSRADISRCQENIRRASGPRN